MAKHTPGPWELGNMGSVVTQNPDEQVRISGEYAEETIRVYGGHVICETVSSSNAILIRAAPDMLEALKFAKSVIKSGEPWSEECERVIGGAIAKAGGNDD